MNDKVIFKDGHTEILNSGLSDLFDRNSYQNDEGEWCVEINDSTFVWKNDCWMEL